MIVIAVSSPEERVLVDRVMRSAELKLGRRIPWRLAAFHGQSVEDVAAVLSAGLMSHAEAATTLRVSTRTVRRRVADGDLVAVGRRVTTASVLALAGGAR